MIELDGSFGEGGGQILRSSLALPLLTGKAFHLRNVRARRAKPGLRPQHLMSVRAAATIGSAQVVGASLGSSELIFEPGPVAPGIYRFAIGTAGATGLVLHTLYLPPALRGGGPSDLTLVGGTHVNASPCYHFLETTWKPYLEFAGLRVDLRLVRPGFYPRGGGVVEARIHPCSQVRGVELDELPPVEKVTGFSAVANLPEEITERQARRALQRLKPSRLKVRIRNETWEGGPGTVLGITLGTAPVPTFFFGLGARGKPAERVADEAADQALAYLKTAPAVDAHSADQLVLPLALAVGPSRFRVAAVTDHLRTNIAVIRRFVDRDIECLTNKDGSGMVRIA
jgi:RNA 3'-terminal phosphate cyclase (ATP)